MPSNNLEVKIKSGLKWNSLFSIIQPLSQVGFTIILARILSIRDFGLVAMTMIFIDFINVLFSFGIENSLIHFQNTNNSEESGLFYLSLIVNIILFILTIGLSKYIAIFFNEVGILNVLKLLSIIYLLNALSFPKILMRRKLLFQKLALIRIGSLITGNVVGLIFALFGFAYWSLAIRLLTERAVFSLLVWIRYDWRPSFPPDFRGCTKLMKFGMQIWGSNFLGYLSKNIGKIVIGKLLNVNELGVFAISMSIADKMPERALNIVVQVMGPVYAKSQYKLYKLRKLFLNTEIRLCAIILPALFGLYMISDIFIKAFYGFKWQATIPILKILIFWALFASFEHLNRSLLISKGKGKFLIYSRAIEFFASLISLIILINYFQVIGVAYSMAFTSAILYIFSKCYILSLLKLDVLKLLRQLFTLIAPTIIMMITIKYLKANLLEINIWFEISICILIGIIAYLPLLYFVGPNIVKLDIKKAINKL